MKPAEERSVSGAPGASAVGGGGLDSLTVRKWQSLCRHGLSEKQGWLTGELQQGANCYFKRLSILWLLSTRRESSWELSVRA